MRIVVPHVTDEIQEWVTRVAQMPVPRQATPTFRKEVAAPDVCIIEVGTQKISLPLVGFNWQH